MLSKQIGPSKIVTVTATTQTVTLSNTDGSIVKKVRIAVQDSTDGALIAFNTTTNLTTAGILVPNQTAEHFSTDGSNLITVVRSANKDILVSITPIA